MKMKKGNAGIVVLVMVLFVLVIAMAGYIAYDKLSAKDNDNNVVNNNQTINSEEHKITSLEEATMLMEKYKSVPFNVREQEYYFAETDLKEEFTIKKIEATSKMSIDEIKNTSSYASTNYDLVTVEGEDVNYYSYENVLKSLKKLFGSNAELKKELITSCPKSYLYLKEYDGFVEVMIGCGYGAGTVTSNDLQVYDFENINDVLYIYTRQVLVTNYSNTVQTTETTHNKYTFKLQDTGYYLDKVENLSNASVSKEI